MKEIKYLTIFLIILLLILGLFSVLGINPDIGEDDSGIEAREPELENKVYTEETEDFKIEFQYPQIKGVDENISNKINKEIESIKQESVNDFKEFIPEINDLPEAPPSELVASYTTQLINEEFLSLEFIISTYMTGAAHPFSSVRTLNYNLELNKEITLDNAFTGDYLEQFSNISSSEISQMDINPDQSWVLEGTNPIPQNFQSFVLDGESVVLIFDPYQVAPYAAGIIRVKINSDKFSNFINEDSTLNNYY